MSCARIKNKPIRFVDPQKKVIMDLQGEIRRLQKENASLRRGLSMGTAPSTKATAGSNEETRTASSKAALQEGIQLPAWGGDQGHYVAALYYWRWNIMSNKGGSNVRKSTDSGAVLGLDEDDNDLLDSLMSGKPRAASVAPESSSRGRSAVPRGSSAGSAGAEDGGCNHVTPFCRSLVCQSRVKMERRR